MQQQILINDLPEVIQKPIIEYSKLKEISDKVKAEVDSFGIDKIEPTEENLSLMKKTRASLNNRFKEFEERRKFIKSTILKPYDDFEKSYKTLISSVFNDAESSLKSNINTVEAEILNEKTQGLKSYFESVNTFDFLKFEDLNLKINRSTGDKAIQDSINEQLEKIQQDLATIDTLPNKDRVLVRYQFTRDLNASISAVNIEMEREKAIAEAKQRESEPAIQQEEPQVTEEPKASPQEAQEVYTASFRVTATMQQLKELKEFMELRGIRYE